MQRHPDEELCGEIANQSTGETCALKAGHKGRRHFTRRALDRQKERISAIRASDPDYRAKEAEDQREYREGNTEYRKRESERMRDAMRVKRAAAREAKKTEPQNGDANLEGRRPRSPAPSHMTRGRAFRVSAPGLGSSPLDQRKDGAVLEAPGRRSRPGEVCERRRCVITTLRTHQPRVWGGALWSMLPGQS